MNYALTFETSPYKQNNLPLSSQTPIIRTHTGPEQKFELWKVRIRGVLLILIL